MTRAAIVAVVGSGDGIDPAVREASERLGSLIAKKGWTLVTGGRSGVMEAASRGARSERGRVVGILPGRSPDEANPYVEIPIATGLGDARNAVIATAADVVVAVSGEHGTLSEIALALKLGKPVFTLLSRWESVPGTRSVPSPEEAVAEIDRALARR